MTTRSAEVKVEKSDGQTAASAPSMMVVDMGKKQSRKRIKRLRKGKGSLMEKVTEMLHELQEGGAVSDARQPVVIVVREKARRWRFGRLGM